MTVSNTEIANSALTRMGAKRIASIDDTNNEHARVLKAELPILRDKLLRQYRWRFAMKRVALAEDATPPAYGFDHRYGLPPDYLSVVEIGDFYVGLDLSDYRNADAAEYSIESGFVLTNFTAPLKVRYVAVQTEVGLYDPHFVDALASLLAYHCCERVTQSSAKKAGLQQDLARSLLDAVQARAIERPPQPLPDDTWMIGRLGAS